MLCETAVDFLLILLPLVMSMVLNHQQSWTDLWSRVDKKHENRIHYCISVNHLSNLSLKYTG